MAQTRPKLAVITAAMADGTGLEEFRRRYAQTGRFFDVGIAEEHAVSFSCGMSTLGITPVFAVYSTFLQRTFDQLIHDAAIEPKHIVLGIDRAGVLAQTARPIRAFLMWRCFPLSQDHYLVAGNLRAAAY